LTQQLDLKPRGRVEWTPLRIHSSLMNCFNEIIFSSFLYNDLKFYIWSRDRKCLVPKSQFRQKWTYLCAVNHRHVCFDLFIFIFFLLQGAQQWLILQGFSANLPLCLLSFMMCIQCAVFWAN